MTPAVVHLPLGERLLILEVLLRSIREELFGEKKMQTVTPFEALRGILKSDGAAPADAELRDDYTDYLIRKYA